MKEFYYDNLDEYLEMSDNYDNPKTIKMYRISSTMTNAKRMIAVTYLRTCLIGWEEEIMQNEVTDFEDKLKARNHRSGVILEVGKLG